MKNDRYNPAGNQTANSVRFDVEDQSMDLVFLISVFTHMFPKDVKGYLQEIRRCLKPSGVAFITFFLINEDRKREIAAGTSQFKFEKRSGGYYSEDVKLHEAAIAYDEADVLGMLKEAGLQRDKVILGRWSGRTPADFGQDVIVAARIPDTGKK